MVPAVLHYRIFDYLSALYAADQNALHTPAESSYMQKQHLNTGLFI